MPLILLAKMRLDREGRASAGEVKKQFQRGILNLKMALEILKNQQEGTFEHDVYLGAKDSLPQLQNFVSSQLWYDDMKINLSLSVTQGKFSIHDFQVYYEENPQSLVKICFVIERMLKWNNNGCWWR